MSYHALETSLIGKALGFGSNEYRFESCVSNMNYSYPYSYLINSINTHASHKTLRVTLHYSRRAFELLKTLYRLGVIGNYYFSINARSERLLIIYPTYYKLTPLSKHFRMLSTPSHTLFISYKALRLLNKRVGSAAYILSTSVGILTHHEALRKKIGGILLGFLFI